MKGVINVENPIKWDDIKIGQAFYFYGCEGFGIKIDEFTSMTVECTDTDLLKLGECNIVHNECRCEFYLLPEDIASAIEETFI